LFGSDVNKDVLIHFLNTILPNEAQIYEVTYLKTEHIGHSEIDRKVVYDVYCQNEKRRKIYCRITES